MVNERRYDIDWLRVIAIGLLLIYHTAIVFQPWAMFIGFIRSEEYLEAVWIPMSLLNVWRIPLLFYVSGMGVYFAMRHRNWRQFLVERFKRILLPFLFGIFTIAPLHLLIFQEYYEMSLNYHPNAGHLWFLGNIFVYVLILIPFFFLLKKIEKFKKRVTVFLAHPLGLVFVSLFFVMEVLTVQPTLFELYAQTWHGFFLGLLAFFFGFLMVYCGEPFWKTTLKWRWLYFGLAVILFGLRVSTFEMKPPRYLIAFESNCWIFAVFGFGYNLLNHPGKLLSYLSQAAYPIYIIHMFVLYTGASLILPLGIPIFLKFLTVTFFTICSSLLIYEFFIRRIRYIRPLFGLKPTNK